MSNFAMRRGRTWLSTRRGRAWLSKRRGHAWLLSLIAVRLGPARSTASIVRDAMRSANAAHGYPLALREADATAAAALRRALQHGA